MLFHFASILLVPFANFFINQYRFQPLIVISQKIYPGLYSQKTAGPVSVSGKDIIQPIEHYLVAPGTVIHLAVIIRTILAQSKGMDVLVLRGDVLPEDFSLLHDPLSLAIPHQSKYRAGNLVQVFHY